MLLQMKTPLGRFEFFTLPRGSIYCFEVVAQSRSPIIVRIEMVKVTSHTKDHLG